MRDEARVDAIVAEWLAARSRGEAADPGALIRDHPELAEELQRRFAALNLVDLAFARLPETPAIPERIGPFALDELLGVGGMGSVYRAHLVDTWPGLSPGQTVALKVVHPHLMASEGFFQRFLREAKLGRRVAHENVVRTLGADVREQHGRRLHYLVMELVDGQTLRELSQELERVPEQLLRHVGREVARGLVAVHAAGVVHRDIKPENVIISLSAAGTDDPVAGEGDLPPRVDHVVKLMDLGVARLVDESLRLSRTGAFVGSLEYAAPEQFAGRDVDGLVDLHALGIVLYELATGVHPFRGDDFRSVMRRIMDEEPRRAGELNPQLSPFFEEVVGTLLAKRPEDRFADAATLLSVLEDGEDAPWWRERVSALRAATHRPLRRMRIPRETAVHGRDPQLAHLVRAYESAKAGEGRVVLLEGEAGIGKSRLVDELVARLQRQGEDLEFLFGSYSPGGAASASGAFSTAYREQFGEESSARWLPRCPSLAPAFDALLRGDAPPSGSVSLTMDSLQTCFVQATRALAEERTTVVLIDDLHFAPDEGRALFASLALAVPGHRVLLLGTMRPGVSRDWIASLTRSEHASHVEIPRLGPKDLSELLRDSLRSETLAEQLAFRIGTKSDGNPFFVFEIIRGLREGHFITQQEDGSWVSTGAIDEIRIPSSVLDLVSARVADLSEREREILDVASCWGFEFDPLLIADVVGLGPIVVLRALAWIEKKHRLVHAAGRRYVFDHHQVQEALYGAMSELLREGYHAALASALEARTRAAEGDPDALDGALCAQLCDHYLKGRQGDRALRYLQPAQQHLENGYLEVERSALLERALAVPGLLQGIERANLLISLTYALSGRAGARDRPESCAREALSLALDAGDRKVAAYAATALGRYLWIASRPEEAEAACRESLQHARAIGETRCEASATLWLASLYRTCGRFAEARAYSERLLELGREMGDPLGEVLGRGNLGSICTAEGDFAAAREHQLRSLAVSRELGDLQAESNALGNLGNIHISEGALESARECHARCLELSREIGDRIGESAALVNLGAVWLALGDTDRARDALVAARALAVETGVPYPEGFALFRLGRLADEEGDPAAAMTWIDESLALRRRAGHADGVAHSLIALGELRLRAGDADGARSALDEAVALAREQGRAAEVARAAALLARLPGAAAGAVRSAEDALAEAGESGDTPELRLWLWQAGGDRAHLAAARRLLDAALAKVPAQHHDAMRRNVRVNREILAACEEQGI